MFADIKPPFFCMSLKKLFCCRFLRNQIQLTYYYIIKRRICIVDINYCNFLLTFCICGLESA